MTRRLLFLIILTVLVYPLCAQTGNLTVSTRLNTPFQLFVDEVLQNEKPLHSITITDIPNGKHQVRVVLDDVESHCFGQWVTINSQGLSREINREGSYYGWDVAGQGVQPELTLTLLTDKVSLMTDHDFETAYASLTAESYDNTRLMLAKQIASQNLLKASYIAEICKLFSFESNRLEFAKFAYSRCAEKNRYYLVNASFNYDASKRELEEFINGQ